MTYTICGYNGVVYTIDPDAVPRQYPDMYLRIECRVCGKAIYVSYKKGNSRYCSDACKKLARKEQLKRRVYKPRDPREITCAKCGKTFMGKYGKKYCMHCLETGDSKMRTLLWNRKGD